MQYKTVMAVDATGGQHEIVWATRGDFMDMNAAEGLGYESAGGRYFLGHIDGPELHRVSESVLENHSTGETYSLVI
ncbi:hypothetical protein FJ414_26675 [Mesorhizobium sp. B3-1-6]|uniref:hypothetical protein n=1 Tax=Mesorhizobium sp. B3-1-6 TaxID=2589895 RepID=UPI00112E34F5|nr:hypothetical protein [Mesorhizobium sp. B3-1-6]TPI29004.1 hypothetical protein FJ414_26675 [Mesorhizobium sp. B3-1-6]